MISMIAAVAQNGTIGDGGGLLWSIPEDLRRFKRITTGYPVVMGRRTFESLGRPLPNRTNVVITRNPDYQADGCTVVGSLEQAVALFPDTEEIFIIGGGEIYALAMPIAERLYITFVERSYPGSVVFPTIDPAKWLAVNEERFERGETFPYPFRYVDFTSR